MTETFKYLGKIQKIFFLDVGYPVLGVHLLLNDVKKVKNRLWKSHACVPLLCLLSLCLLSLNKYSGPSHGRGSNIQGTKDCAPQLGTTSVLFTVWLIELSRSLTNVAHYCRYIY